MITPQYLAGFFDGEGHIGFCGRTRHTLQLKLSNCNPEIMLDIQKEYGGKLRSIFPKKPQHALSYTLTWSAKQAIPVMQAMLPFLRIKKAEVEFILNTWTPLVDLGTKWTRWVPTGHKEDLLKARSEFQAIAKTRRGDYPLAAN